MLSGFRDVICMYCLFYTDENRKRAIKPLERATCSHRKRAKKLLEQATCSHRKRAKKLLEQATCSHRVDMNGLSDQSVSSENGTAYLENQNVRIFCHFVEGNSMVGGSLWRGEKSSMAKRKPSEMLDFQGLVVVATGLEPVTPSM